MPSSQKHPAATIGGGPAVIIMAVPVALLALANKRTDRVAQHLINRDGISAKRIIACQSQIEKAAAATPRVALAL